MKTHLLTLALFGLGAQIVVAQNSVSSNSQTPFNYSYWSAIADKKQLNAADKLEFINAHKKLHHHPKATNSSVYKPNLQNNISIQSSGCVNIDFEGGNTNGWALTSGFHPGFNALGCCPTQGGQQLIVSGGNDPLGGFSTVAPGGNFSLLLGDNQNGGEADRIEQTFLVNANNANFTYRYAVVFQDPGHVVAQQPAFQIEMLDSNNTQIPCTFYNVAAGANIPGFVNSTVQNGVIYKPWTNVAVDLTNYIGQNVTIRFTTYDCSLGGHFGYAYIDGICAAFVKGTSDTICAGATKNYCAPNGFANYVWNGPNITNVAGQCVNASAIGVYTCQTTLVTGCTGPEFTYTLSNFPLPNVAFNFNNLTPCTPNVNFINTSNISFGSVATYTWNFGNATSNLYQPTNNFTNAGNYNVILNATSDKGCTNAATQTVTIFPLPTINFNLSNVCLNTISTFTNLSSINVGSISSYTWNFGNASTSSVSQPTLVYTTPSLYNVQLSATSDVGCVSQLTKTLQIFPLPQLSIISNNVCFGGTNSFVNNSSIVSGNITNYYWDFNMDAIVDANSISPTYNYTTTGNYIVNVQAISNNNCISNQTVLAQVYNNPATNFVFANKCFGNAINFVNTSTIALNNSINTYTWNFGNNQYSNQSQPSIQYNQAGNYVVTLSATSNNNCVSSLTQTVTVFALPNTNFSNNTACLNQSTQFNNTTLINNGTIIKWRWDFENDGIWDDTLTVNPVKTYANYGNYNCKLQAVSNNYCANTKINPVVVHANPVAKFTVKSACLGDVTTFSNQSTSVDGGISSYQWDFNGDNVTDNIFPNPSYTYAANGVYLVKLEVQTIYGCSNVFSKSLNINPKPQPAFAAPNPNGCPMHCIKFNNSSTIATGNIVTTQWIFGDGTAPNYELNPTHCYDKGNYNVTLKLVSDSGCISTIVKNNYVNVFPKPTAGFAVWPPEVDENEPNISVNSTAVGAGSTNYFINDGGTYLSQTFNHTFTNTATTPVIFQVVKNEFGCADTTSQIIKFKPSFVIYIPNAFTPNGDGVNDDFFAKGVGINKFSIQIYDRWGHKIFVGNSLDESWDGTMKNSTEPIKQDVYVWKAQVVDVFNKYHDLTGHVSLIK